MKLSVFKCTLEARLGRPLRIDSESAYLDRVVDRVTVRGGAGKQQP